MSEPTPTASKIEAASTFLANLSELGLAVASMIGPGMNAIPMVLAILPDLQNLVNAGLALATGEEPTPEELAEVDRAIRQQRNRAKYEQWRVRSAAGESAAGE